MTAAPWVWCGTQRLAVPRADAFEPPAAMERLGDLGAAVEEAMAAPLQAPRLRELARGARSVVVTIPDSSRPCPSEPVLAALLDELAAGGVRDDGVTVAIGCGLHATTGPEERERLAGPSIARRVRVVDAQGIETETADLGETSLGAPARIARVVAEADLVITVGRGRAAPLRRVLRRRQGSLHRLRRAGDHRLDPPPGVHLRAGRQRGAACPATRSRPRCARSPRARRCAGA